MGTSLNVQTWSPTAADNDDADDSIVWTEGQLPSTVNNSARGMMAAIAKLLLDIGGGVVATGTGDAIVLTTNRSIEASHIANGFFQVFRASAANTGAVTVAIDGISAKDVKSQSGSALTGGEIVSGGIYFINWSSTANAFLLTNIGGSVSASSTTTFTNKTINAANNTISNLAVSMFAASAIVTEAEGLSSSDNDTSIPTVAAVIAAIEAALAGGGLSVASAADIWAGTENGKVITPAAMAAALAPQTLTDGSTVTVNFASGINFNLAIGGNRTMAFGSITSAMVGRSGWIKITQDGTGSRTMAFTDSKIYSINGEALTLSTGANDIDVVHYTIYATDRIGMYLARDLGT